MQAGRVQLRRDVDARRPVPHVVGQRGLQPEVVERRRPKLPDEMVDVAIDPLGDALECPHFLGEIRVVAAPVPERADPMRQRRELFAELIVHLARDAAPLVLLGEYEPRQELGAGALGFGALALGEIEVRAHDPDHRAARLAPDGKPPRQHVDEVAGLVAQPELSFVGPGAPRARLSCNRSAPLPVVRMEQPLPRPDVRLDFVVGVPEHLLPVRRVHDRAGFQVPVPDAFLRAGERQPQPLLALTQRRFGALAVGDVEVHAHDSDDGPSGCSRTGKPREST